MSIPKLRRATRAARFLAAIAGGLLLGIHPLSAARERDAVPPIPKGFGSSAEVMQAIQQHELKLVNMAVAQPENVDAEFDVEYGTAGGRRALQLDIYRPKGIRQPVPAVIMIHGGGWKGGQRQVYRLYCIRLAEKGYVTATISYRFSSEAPYPAAVQDVKCAVRWLRANASKYHVNPDRIAVLGGSAGGHLAMMVGYTPDVKSLEGDGGHAGVSSRVQAVIDFYGPTDLTTEFARKADVVVAFMGGRKYEEAEAVYREASPITHVTKNAPPTLILHGTIDDIVPISQADALASRLKELGVPYEYERLEGWPHTMDLAESVSRRCLWRVERFLAKYLPLPAGATTRGTPAPTR